MNQAILVWSLNKHNERHFYQQNITLTSNPVVTITAGLFEPLLDLTLPKISIRIRFFSRICLRSGFNTLETTNLLFEVCLIP